MAHDIENPRTRRYSKLKTLFRGVELILKKSFLFIFVLINFIFHYKKNKYIDIENYKNIDNRFVNYFFFLDINIFLKCCNSTMNLILKEIFI